MKAQDHPLTRAAMNDSEWPKSQVCCSSYCGCACAYCRYQVQHSFVVFRGFSCENYRQNSSGSNLKVEGLCRVVSVVSCRVDRRSEGSQNQLCLPRVQRIHSWKRLKTCHSTEISGFGFLCNHVLVSILWILDDAWYFYDFVFVAPQNFQGSSCLCNAWRADFSLHILCRPSHSR